MTIINKPHSLHLLFHLPQTCTKSFQSWFRFSSCKPAGESSAMQNSRKSSKKWSLTSFEQKLCHFFNCSYCKKTKQNCKNIKTNKHCVLACSSFHKCVCVNVHVYTHINTYTPMCPCTHIFMCRVFSSFLFCCGRKPEQLEAHSDAE